jgi:hypothetical protein
LVIINVEASENSNSVLNVTHTDLIVAHKAQVNHDNTKEANTGALRKSSFKEEKWNLTNKTEKNVHDTGK